MSISAQDVKGLREATGAPMMECKKALVEAEGDMDKAKRLLRESGAAAAAKRAGRATAAGVATAAVNDDRTQAGAILLESETDFVARNEDFIRLAESLAEATLASDDQATLANLQVNGKSASELIEGAVANIRENIKLRKVVKLDRPEKTIGQYVHHDKTKASLSVLTGDASNIKELADKVAVQIVAFPPTFVKKEDVPADVIEQEIETETNRAIKDGKPAEVAKKIAEGRVNKEYFQTQVLTEQPFYLDAKLTTVQWLKENAQGGGATIEEAHYLAVGQSDESDED